MQTAQAYNPKKQQTSEYSYTYDYTVSGNHEKMPEYKEHHHKGHKNNQQGGRRGHHG
jgi:hypothetical protein